MKVKINTSTVSGSLKIFEFKKGEYALRPDTGHNGVVVYDQKRLSRWKPRSPVRIGHMIDTYLCYNTEKKIKNKINNVTP